jgi:hypothetical protein
MAKVRESRNEPLTKGIGKYSRSAMYKKRALYKRKKTGFKKDVKEDAKTKVKGIGGDKNGGTRTVPIQREVIMMNYLGLQWRSHQKRVCQHSAERCGLFLGDPGLQITVGHRTMSD